MITPSAISGPAIVAHLLLGGAQGLGQDGHEAKRSLSRIYHARVYNEIGCPPHAISQTPHPGPRSGKETHRHGHQRSSGSHRARASQPGAHHQARRSGRTRPPGGGARRLPHPDRKSAAHERRRRPPVRLGARVRRRPDGARRPSPCACGTSASPPWKLPASCAPAASASRSAPAPSTGSPPSSCCRAIWIPCDASSAGSRCVLLLAHGRVALSSGIRPEHALRRVQSGGFRRSAQGHRRPPDGRMSCITPASSATPGPSCWRAPSATAPPSRPANIASRNRPRCWKSSTASIAAISSTTNWSCPKARTCSISPPRSSVSACFRRSDSWRPPATPPSSAISTRKRPPWKATCSPIPTG